MAREELLKTAKPILFNTEMVRAILGGTKSVTRRVVKQDTKAILSSQARLTHPDLTDAHFIERLCNAPYQAGGILYVRETWCRGNIDAGENEYGELELYVSQAVGEEDIIPKEYCIRHNIGIEETKWRPSIHMPKSAARIFLKVTGVRVERLQDITNQEVINEGLCVKKIESYIRQMPNNLPEFIHAAHLIQFVDLWNSTVKRAYVDRYGWLANPWVWVIEFERI